MTVQPRLVSNERVAPRILNTERSRYRMEYTVRNARSEPWWSRCARPVWARDTEIQDQSLEGEMRDARTIVWRVAVPANGQTVLTATIETGG